MFGMGFMEIFLVLMVAIIALGPEKLPNAVVDIAKFFKKFKSGVEEAKSTIDNELNISEMKQQAEDFKVSVNEVTNIAKIDINDLEHIEDKPKKKEKSKEKSKKEKMPLEDKEV